MHSYYQLFDLESGNLIADFAQEHEAWDALRRLAPEEIRGLGLMHMENDELTLIAMDEELVRRVVSNVIPFSTREPAKRSRKIR